MKSCKAEAKLTRLFSYKPLVVRLAALAILPVISPAPAQTTNMAELRELRVACLESFNSAKIRLDELQAFVGQQAERERGAANQLFEPQQNAASAKRRNSELRQQVRQCTNPLSRAQSLEPTCSGNTRTYRGFEHQPFLMGNATAWFVL